MSQYNLNFTLPKTDMWMPDIRHIMVYELCIDNDISVGITWTFHVVYGIDCLDKIKLK